MLNAIFFFSPHAQEPTRPAIPILLAVGAVHQHLIQNGLRMSTSIIAETAQCFSTHQFACLIGYGARLCFLRVEAFEILYFALLSFNFIHVKSGGCNLRVRSLSL